MSGESVSAPGFYGKVPALGDFVTRRLTRQFIDPWDDWLQNAMACSREQLGEAWLNSYLTSPLWRFALTAGACGTAPRAGVMMPSVDRVGRYFPLTITHELPAGSNPIGLMLSATDWYARSEALVLSALEENGFNLDDFDAQVEQLGAPAMPEAHCASALNAAGQNAWHLPLTGALVADDVACLAQQLIGERFSSYSLWWTEGSEQVPPCLLVCQGLPPIQGFASMLGSAWETRVWHIAAADQTDEAAR